MIRHSESPADVFTDVIAQGPALTSLPVITENIRHMKQHSAEFKRMAVDRVKKGEQPAAVAKELKIHNSLIYKWVKTDAEEKPLLGRGEAATKAKLERSTKRSTKGKTIHSYPEEYKRKAVARLVNEELDAVAKDLGVHKSSIRDWKRKIEAGEPLYAIGKHAKRGAKVAKRAYVKTVDKVNGVPNAEGTYATGDSIQLRRNVQSCIVSLRGVKGKINVSDPVHLVAMVVLATLEGKI